MLTINVGAGSAVEFFNVEHTDPPPRSAWIHRADSGEPFRVIPASLRWWVWVIAG
ncbi:hypothetical protein [Actinacidiphila oryziradicis]|jgi:hypothetical protein|uniref:hypothetical protein n=1 Tax=Actinacidiphila oryziradicis TaxID=2571141 RepID=UPI0023F43D16|nr:hypothetical protein [Actinacidiphila oryziradicis]